MTTTTTPLLLAELHGSLTDPSMNSMNFLNEISARYPDAISFAAGRPTEEFFETSSVHRYLDRYTEYLGAELGMSEEEIGRTLLQYGRTKGVIHDLIRAHLAVDEEISVPAEAIVVTVGCQEAMFLVLRALGSGPRDVVFAVDPTYVGFAGAARLADLPVWPVDSGPRGIDLDDLQRKTELARAQGLRPRGLYVIPDVANPTGVSMDLETRKALLRVADESGLLLLEDNPYGTFAGTERIASLKTLDTTHRVVYFGSFAKTAFPGARVGYVLADQQVMDPAGNHGLLADRLAVIKSMLTVNTSPLAQAIVGGVLLANDFSLRAGNRRQVAHYSRNLQLLREGLSRRLPADITWNAPSGGFFLTLTVPFLADEAALERSAGDHGVLWTPMSYFYAGDGGRHQIRLSFSQLTPQEMDTGLDRLAASFEDLRALSS